MAVYDAWVAANAPPPKPQSPSDEAFATILARRSGVLPTTVH